MGVALLRLCLELLRTLVVLASVLVPSTVILLFPAWLQLHTFPEALAHSRTNPTPQPRLSSADSGRTSSHGDNAQAAAPSSHAPSEARSLAKEGERAQRSAAERARGGGISNFGRRTPKSYDEKITEYIWDGDDLIHERTTDKKTAQTQPLTTWIQEPGTFTPLAKIQGRKRYGIVSDHLGTPTFLATEAGKIAWHAQLDIYGVPREQPALVDKNEQTDNPWRFPGQYEDAETGLYYNRYRYYDPELGRYLNEDPIGIEGGIGLFRYPGNSLAIGDPLGLSPWAWDPDNGMGHHLVPRRKASSVGWDHLASERNAPTFFPEPYKPGVHEELHRVQRPHIGPSQGPWGGAGDELLDASRKGLKDFKPKGTLKIPATGEVLAKGVSATEAFDVLVKWHKKQTKKRVKASCGK